MEFPTTKITISKEALSQEVNGETVILDLKSESYFGLDEVGTRVWQLLQEHGDVERVYITMLEEFEVDSDTLASDMNALIDDFIKKELIIPQ